jgi:AmiR/NasT family two-component response regulator
MGDDAEYYMEQMEEEQRFQQSIKDEQDREMTRKRIQREKEILSNQKNKTKKD